jgi:hypothetical protein
MAVNTGKIGTLNSIPGRTMQPGHNVNEGVGGISRLLSSTIVPTQVASVVVPIRSVDADSTLAVTDLAENNILLRNASSTLVVTQASTGVGPLPPASASSAIVSSVITNFNQTGFGLNANNALTLSQLSDNNIKNLIAETPDDETDDPVLIGNGFTFNWSQTARIADTFIVSADSTVALSQDAPQPTGKRSVVAESTIEALVFADTQTKTRDAPTVIVATQTAVVEKVTTAISVLTLTDIADEGFVPLFAESTITLSQIGRPNPRERDGSSTITLSQSAQSSIRNLSVTSTIPISHNNNVLRPYRVDAQSEISGVTDDTFIPPTGPIIPGVPFGMTQEATAQVDPIRNPSSLIQLASVADVVHVLGGAVDLTATSVIGIIHSAILNETGDALSVIDTLVGTAVANKNTVDLSSPIVLQSVALVQTQRDNNPASNNLTLKHASAFTLINDRTKCDYSPFIGTLGPDTVPPRLTLPQAKSPALDPSIRFRLVYPPFDEGANVDTLDLRAPTFGNRERLQMTRVARETSGGTLTVFADPIWPKVHTLQMQFTALKVAQARGILDFIERWLGLEIGIYDYEGRVWKGVIINPDEAVVQDGRESYSATIEFEAERVYGADVTQQATTVITPAQESVGEFQLFPGQSTLALANTSSFVKVPVAAATSTLAVSQAAPRNSLFSESMSAFISLSQSGAEVDFDSFGNLLHNWDAENTVGSDADPLSSWSDLGSNPVTLNATVNQEPTLRDSVLNGKRVVEFRHSVSPERIISASNIPLFDIINGTGTIFIVMIVREVLSAGNETVIGNNVDKILLGGTTSTERPVALRTSEGVTALETPTSVLGNGTSQLLTIKRAGNNVTFRRNKTAESGATLATNPSASNELLYVGGFSGSGNSVDQDIAQILMYDDALSDEDILVIESLLNVKWGV